MRRIIWLRPGGLAHDLRGTNAASGRFAVGALDLLRVRRHRLRLTAQIPRPEPQQGFRFRRVPGRRLGHQGRRGLPNFLVLDRFKEQSLFFKYFYDFIGSLLRLTLIHFCD